MGQDEQYSDTSVVAQKVSDESMSRDEFEVFLCTICDWKDPNKEAGDFGDPAGLGQYNEEFRNKERFFWEFYFVRPSAFVQSSWLLAALWSMYCTSFLVRHSESVKALVSEFLSSCLAVSLHGAHVS